MTKNKEPIRKIRTGFGVGKGIKAARQGGSPGRRAGYRRHRRDGCRHPHHYCCGSVRSRNLTELNSCGSVQSMSVTELNSCDSVQSMSVTELNSCDSVRNKFAVPSMSVRAADCKSAAA